MTKNSRTIAALVVAALILLLGFVFSSNLVDFPVYYSAGRSLLSGRTDLYAPDFALGRVMDYRYPPLFLFAVLPLSLTTYPIAAYVWYLFCAGAVVGCTVIVSRVFYGSRASKTMRVLVALAVAQYFVMALHYGNAHLIAVFLLFASLYFFLRRKDIPAAALISLAITIKLTPALLLPYFALKKRWTLLVAISLFVMMINIVPSIYFGFRENNSLLRGWYGHVIESQTFHEENGPINLSLKGQTRRYLSLVDYSQRVDGDVRYPNVNVLDASRETTEQVWMVIAATIFVGVLVFIMWRTIPTMDSEAKPQRQLISLELGLMICLTLLVGPLTSKIYFIALLWPAACLADFAATRNDQTAGRVVFRGIVAVAVLNVVLPLLPGRSVQRWLLVVGADFYVNLVMMGMLAYALVIQSRSLRLQSVELRTQVPSEARRP
jgi:hypothetical protein